MRVYIVGAANTGKKELAHRVKEQAPHMEIFAVPEWGPDDPALGANADYRTELSLAIDRMDASLNEEQAIHTHSLIDSVAHTAYNFSEGAETLSPETLSAYFVTAHTIAAIMRDSLRYDYIFFLPGSEDEYGEQIEIALEMVMHEFAIPYIELGQDIDENVDLISGLIHGREVGTRDDLQEPNGDD